MKNLFLTILLIVPLLCISQNYRFGKVSEEELQEKFNPNDSSANATVLYKNESITFKFVQDQGFIQTRSVHERIKIYNSEGFKWATKKISLYDETNSRSEKLTSLKGYTYNLVNGKIEEEKLKKEGQFEEEVNKYWRVESFTLPNIQEGCIIEYQYDIVSPFSRIDDVDLQYSIPINKLELTIKTPEYYQYKKITNPRANFIPKLETGTDESTAQFSGVSNYSDNNSGRARTVNNSRINYQENVITCNETDIPALKKEVMVDNLDNYRAKLVLEIVATKWPNQPTNYISTTWDKVAQSIYQISDFGDQLNKTSYYSKEIDAILAGQQDEVAKVASIYNLVKSKVRWNGFLGLSSEIGVRKAFMTGTGNVADINLMLISMLRYAGLNANPVLISTKENGIPLSPTIKGFNYVICLVQGNNFAGFLDATDIYGTINVLPSRALNWRGRVIMENGSSDWVNLIPETSSVENYFISATLDGDSNVMGKARLALTNQLAHEHRSKYGNIDKEQFTQILEKEKMGLSINDIEIANVGLINKPITVTYDYTNSNKVEKVGEKLIFSPLLFLEQDKSPFIQETRKYPIDFKYPLAKKYVINIDIPEGYAVESIPQNGVIEYKDGLGTYSFLIENKNSSIQLMVNLDYEFSFITAEDYQYFKEFDNLIRSKESEQIVLRKI